MFRRNRNKTELTISNETIVRVIAFILGTYLLINIVEKLSHAITLIFLSFFLALALNPAVHFVSSKLKNKSRIRGTAISYGVVMSILIGFLLLVVPPIFTQTTEFIQDVPDTLSNIQTDDSALGDFIRRYELEEQVQKLSNDWASNLGSIEGPILTTAGRVLTTVISIVTVFVLTFMMLVEGPKWLKIMWNYIPPDRRKRDQEIAKKMYQVVVNFVNGQVLIAAMGAVFALLTMIILSTIFGVTINAVALAGIVFLFGLVPTVGAIISAILVTISVLIVNPTMAIIMLVYFIVYQQIENATIQPIIQSRGNELTPMLVFVAAIIGLSLAGVIGGFLAIPIAGCLKVLIDEYVRNRKAEEKAVTDKAKN